MKRNICLTLGMVLAAVAAKASVVNVHVMDAQTGAPMTNAAVCATFGGQIAFLGERDERYAALTDENGACRFVGTNGNPEVWIEVRDLPGCYDYSAGIKLKDIVSLKDPDPGEHVCMTIAVQRIGKPIPLYSKTVRGSIFGKDFFGAGNDVVSYDLVLGDWLPPQGTGSVADVVFTRYAKEDTGVHTNVVDKGWSFAVETYRYPLKVEFPGDGNGVVETSPLPGSGLRIREAPAEGYKRFVMSYRGKRGDGGNFSTWKGPDEGCYCFRIRSEFDAQGNLTGGLYGKVYRGFSFEPATTKDRVFTPIASLGFTYYLNKTPLDRNLEYDPKRNLNRDRGFRRIAQ